MIIFIVVVGLLIFYAISFELEARRFLKLELEIEKVEVKRLRQAIINMMPFILEDYYPNCATPEYRAAMQAMIEIAKEAKEI